jgi:hypothetical protein
MPVSRLLLSLLAIAAPALSQIASPNSTSSRTGDNARSSLVAPAPKEPWRIIPEQSPDLNSLLGPQNQSENKAFHKITPDEGYRLFTMKPNSCCKRANVASNGEDGADSLCLSIRSYLVARDAPDSDSTHLVGSSTCQPASRYRLKTAEETQPSLPLQR